MALKATRFSGKYVSITSYRRDGKGVATPVWFVEEAGRLFVQTDLRSFKVKRIRVNPAVTVVPCTAGGRPRGEPVPAHAEVLGEEELPHVETLLKRKYRLDMLIIGPLRWVQTTFHLGRARGPSVAVVITPD